MYKSLKIGDNPIMTKKKTDFIPCDGTIPKDWVAPEIANRVQHSEQFIHANLVGLSPPTPLVGTLKLLSHLKPGQYFEGLFPHSPIHLYPHLREEGWQWKIIDKSNEGVLLKIERSKETSC
ncbi:DUF2249 domain-containing protein [Terasakiella sp. SH-1]|uniref:DUF2249 domain-containing protein n=1 Tax=Terasakiella sp. SH-1 TaxID=2560057 RepID=UPI0010745AEA|nr:DUF2249 domain-containing protein [Terasakiella sp. SH-1]